MNVRLRTACALFASLAVIGGGLATYVAAPASADASDCASPCSFNFGPGANFVNGSQELGLKFQADIDGWIAGICFWEAPGETGAHTVSLWDNTGTKVATASGGGNPGVENCVDFNPLVKVTPNTDYTASYTSNTSYEVFPGLFHARFFKGHLNLNQFAGGIAAAGSFPVSSPSEDGYAVDVAFISALTNVTADCLSTMTAPPPASAGPGSLSAQVSWFAATSDPAGCIAGYVVTPSVNGVPQVPVLVTGIGTTTVISGLANGQTYTFTVAAETGRTVGPASAPTGPVTVGAPTAPTAMSVTHAGSGAVKVAFKAPKHTNGAAVTGYTATCSSAGRGTRSKAAKSSPIVVTGLTRGKTYHCTVRAKNRRGNGSAARSAAVKA